MIQMVKTVGISAKILEVLEGTVLATVDVFAAVIESGYRASYTKLNKSVRASERRREKFMEEARQRQRFSNLVSKLRREGLIAGDKRGWKLSNLGRNKLLKIRETRIRKVGLSPLGYPVQPSVKSVLVIFDIPESLKEKRNWFRSVLVGLGFKLLQKSVWIGKVVVPERLFSDLKDLKILDYVHVFSVMETGTIDGQD